MLRHSLTVDLDELQCALGSLRSAQENEEDERDAFGYFAASNVLDVLINDTPESFGDLIEKFEALSFAIQQEEQ